MNVDDFLAVQAARAERVERRELKGKLPGVTIYLDEATVRVQILDPQPGPLVWHQAARLLREAANIADTTPTGGRWVS